MTMQQLWAAPAAIVIGILVTQLLRGVFGKTKRGARLAAAAKPVTQQQVCISCASEDAGAVRFATALLKPALQEVGLHVCTIHTQGGLMPGCECPQALLDAAANSAVFLPVLSEHYHQDFWCMLGLDLALNAQPAAAARNAGRHSNSGPLVLPVFYDAAAMLDTPASASRGASSLVRPWWSPRRVRMLVEAKELGAELAEWVHANQWAANLRLLVDAEVPGGRLECGAERTREQQWQLVVQVVGAVARKMLPGGVDAQQSVAARLAELRKWLCLEPSGATRLQLLRQAAKPRLERQVFISHTGQDEAAQVFAASILKPALEAAGLQTYMDFKQLRHGTMWREELVSAAANSMVFVAVLSKQYYTRYWCMLELDLALNAHGPWGSSGGGHEQDKRRPVVLPVFYDTPKEVFGLTAAAAGNGGSAEASRAGAQGSVARGLWSDPERLRKVVWKVEELSEEWAHRVDAQQWAASLAAMKEQVQHVRRSEHGDKDQEYARLAKGIVAEAVRRMPKVLQMEEQLVGLEAQRDRLLQRMEGRWGLWLSGIGGLGKTTMAKALFNYLSHRFIHSAMVELQKDDGPDKIAERLAAVLRSMGSSGEASDGRTVLSRCLGEWVKDKKVLYVLDNVWTASQLDALLPVAWAEGSAVIVTSRFENFHDSSSYSQVQARLFKTQVELLEDEAAMCLFRQAAGLPGPPVSGALRVLEAAIVKACGGLPLAVRLAGGALCDKSTVREWQDVQQALPQGEVGGDSEDRLKGVVTHCLLHNKRPARVSMFLDVATLLRGQREAHALEVWRAWWGPTATSCFEDLKRSSLVAVDEQGLLAMHDVPVALGRGFVLQVTPGFEEHWGSRVWVEEGVHVGYKEARDAKQLKRGKVVSAMLQRNPHRDFTREWLDDRSLFEDPNSGIWMEHQELPRTRHQIHGDPAGLDPGQVLNDLDLSEVRILWLEGLELPPCGKVLWLEAEGSSVEPWLLQQQQFVILAAHSPEVPFMLPAARLPINQCLTVMHLKGCQQTASWSSPSHQRGQLPAAFGQLPEAFEQLSALTELYLIGCERLTSLPASFGQLPLLQELDLRMCEQLASLPESFGQLSALRKLDLRWCKQLTSLPGSFGQLLVLQHLCLSQCLKLASLPESFGLLSALQKLDLRWCNQLASLPESFGQLLVLQQLNLSKCQKLSSLPESFRQLSTLQKLALNGCQQLASLPKSFGQLSALQELNLSECQQLASLPESFGQLSALQKLNLSECKRLASLPEQFGQLLALQELNLSYCKRLASLPESFRQLSALQGLHLSWCKRLASLPESFGQLSALQTLNLTGCEQLASLPESFRQLSALQELNLIECEQLASLPKSISQLSALQKLELISSTMLLRLLEPLE